MSRDCGTMQTLPKFNGLRASKDVSRAVKQQNIPQRAQFMVRAASVIAEPATIDVKKLDGSSAGTASLSLRVAEPDNAKGLVHRYLVMVRQNARRVRTFYPHFINACPFHTTYITSFHPHAFHPRHSIISYSKRTPQFSTLYASSREQHAP